MPIFELYNADGSLQMDLSSKLSKYLGAINVNLSASGSHTDADLSKGTPWYYVCIPSSVNVRGFRNPSVSFSGGVMSWASETNFVTMGAIIYGIYSNGSN